MQITVETTVSEPIEEVWRAYTTPEDIIQWNAAFDDWDTTKGVCPAGGAHNAAGFNFVLMYK